MTSKVSTVGSSEGISVIAALPNGVVVSTIDDIKLGTPIGQVRIALKRLKWAISDWISGLLFTIRLAISEEPNMANCLDPMVQPGLYYAFYAQVGPQPEEQIEDHRE